MNGAGMQLWLPGASTVSRNVDHLLWYLLLTTGFLTFAVAILVATLMVRYRRRFPDQVGIAVHSDLLEWVWTIGTTVLFLSMFFWGAKVYLDLKRPPDNAVEVYTVGKQWMWTSEHLGGQREINELHVPVGQPVKITLTSQDVIHSFFVPAFRTKQDAVPGRYTTMWFTATRPGKYHLFCAELCGAKHSGMIGWIYAMEPRDFQTWLTSGAPEGSMASSGEKLFHQYGCANCHHFDGHGPGPLLTSLYGRRVQLNNGETVVADESYLRESILNPQAKVAFGFAPIMPSFQGQLTEQQLLQLLEYIRAMRTMDTAPSSSGYLPQDTGTHRGVTATGSTGEANSRPGAR